MKSKSKTYIEKLEELRSSVFQYFKAIGIDKATLENYDFSVTTIYGKCNILLDFNQKNPTFGVHCFILFDSKYHHKLAFTYLSEDLKGNKYDIIFSSDYLKTEEVTPHILFKKIHDKFGGKKPSMFFINSVKSALLNQLILLQMSKNNGRGVQCVKKIVNYLHLGMQDEAAHVFILDCDKISKYKDIEKLLERIFEMRSIYNRGSYCYSINSFDIFLDTESDKPYFVEDKQGNIIAEFRHQCDAESFCHSQKCIK